MYEDISEGSFPVYREKDLKEILEEYYKEE